MAIGSLKRLFKKESSTEEEIKQLVDDDEGELEKSTRDIINNLFEFHDTNVGDIMTHRTDIAAVEITEEIIDVVKLAIDEGFSRIPIYEEDLDNIKGNELQKRASLKASYDFVLSDLDKAQELLKLDEDFSGSLYNEIYFNEYVCYALRARVSLYMHRYDDAIKYATKVIKSKYYTLEKASSNTYSNSVNDYAYIWQYGDSRECIWKVGFTVNSYGGALGTIFDKYDFVSYRPDYVPETWVINSFDNNDLRAAAIFTTRVTGYEHGLQWPLLTKYFGDATFRASNIYHVHQPMVFRLAEQYLIRAEAYVNKEDYTNAGKDISAIRTARYSSYGGNTSMSKGNAMDIIEAERVKELYMEGFRLNDLKRWHKGFERKASDQPAANFVQSNLKVEKDDPLFVWPLEALKFADQYLKERDCPLLIFQDRLNMLDHAPQENGTLDYCAENGLVKCISMHQNAATKQAGSGPAIFLIAATMRNV